MKVTVIIEETGAGAEVITRGTTAGVGGQSSAGGTGSFGPLPEASGAFDGGPGPGGSSSVGSGTEVAAPTLFIGAGGLESEAAFGGDMAAGPAPGTQAVIETPSASESPEPPEDTRATTRPVRRRKRAAVRPARRR